MPCLIWQAADVAKTSPFDFSPSQTPTDRKDLREPRPQRRHLGNRAGWEGRILPPDLDPLLGLSLIWLFASPGGWQSLSFRGKAVSGTSWDGAVRAELPPKALGAEIYKVVPLSVPFYEALEFTWKKSYLVFVGAKWF